MIPLGLIIVAFTLMACSRETQEPEPRAKTGGGANGIEPSKTPPSKVSSLGPQDIFQGCESKNSTTYPLKIDGEDLCIIHNDTNRDGVVQGEGLTLKTAGKSAGQGEAEFANFQKKYALPTFEGLDIAKWHRTQQSIFNTSASSSAQARFNRLYSYSKENGIEFDKVQEIAKQMVNTSNPDTNKLLNALTIATLMLSLKNQKNGFYHATNKMGQAENKRFIDTVVAHLATGQLTLQTAAEAGEKKVSESQTGIYLHENNVLVLYRDLDINDMVSTRTLIHELYHFYQDSQELRLPQLEVERQAYLKSNEFTIQTLGYKTKQDESFVEKFLEDRKILTSSPQGASLWLAYYLQIDNKEKAQQWSKNLEVSLVDRYFVRQYFTLHSNANFHKLTEMVREAFNKAGFSAPLRQQELLQANRYVEIARRDFTQLTQNSKTGGPNEEEVFKKMSTLIHFMAYRILLKRFLDAYPLNGRGGPKNFELHTEFPEFREIASDLSVLQPTYSIYRHYKGVGPKKTQSPVSR